MDLQCFQKRINPGSAGQVLMIVLNEMFFCFFKTKIEKKIPYAWTKHLFWCSLESSHPDASNEYQQCMFSLRNKKDRDLNTVLNYSSEYVKGYGNMCVLHRQAPR